MAAEAHAKHRRADRMSEARVQVAIDAEAQRISNGLTQKDLMRYGASLSTVKEFLARRRWPYGRNLAAISRALGWPPDELIRREARYEKMLASPSRWVTDALYRQETALLLANEWRRRGLGEGDSLAGIPWKTVEDIFTAQPNADPDAIVSLATALGVSLNADAFHTANFPKIEDFGR